MVERTDAIVLSARRYRESSKIVSLFTRSHGKISVVARGVMSRKGGKGGVLQPMSCLSVVLYLKEGRDLQNLTDAEYVERFSRIALDIDRLGAGLSIVEVVNAAVHGQEESEAIYTHLLEALRALNDTSVQPETVHIWALIRFVDDLGYALQTTRCGICHEPVETDVKFVPFSLASGAPLCSQHEKSESARLLSSEAFRWLALLSVSVDVTTEPLRQAGRMDEKTANELRDLLYALLRFHVDGLRTLRAWSVSSLLKS